MEWRNAVKHFRASINRALRAEGFIYLSQNQWQRPYENWRGSFSYEIQATKRGSSRRISIFPQIIKSVRISKEELATVPGAPRSEGYTSYFVYVIKPNERFVEVVFDQPQALVDYSQPLIDRLDKEWIPWMKQKSEEMCNSVEGAYCHVTHVHPQAMYVP